MVHSRYCKAISTKRKKEKDTVISTGSEFATWDVLIYFQ
jgi:hypothetical protein